MMCENQTGDPDLDEINSPKYTMYQNLIKKGWKIDQL